MSGLAERPVDPNLFSRNDIPVISKADGESQSEAAAAAAFNSKESSTPKKLFSKLSWWSGTRRSSPTPSLSDQASDESSDGMDEDLTTTKNGEDELNFVVDAESQADVQHETKRKSSSRLRKLLSAKKLPSLGSTMNSSIWLGRRKESASKTVNENAENNDDANSNPNDGTTEGGANAGSAPLEKKWSSMWGKKGKPPGRKTVEGPESNMEGSSISRMWGTRKPPTRKKKNSAKANAEPPSEIVDSDSDGAETNDIAELDKAEQEAEQEAEQSQAKENEEKNFTSASGFLSRFRLPGTLFGTNGAKLSTEYNEGDGAPTTENDSDQGDSVSDSNGEEESTTKRYSGMFGRFKFPATLFGTSNTAKHTDESPDEETENSSQAEEIQENLTDAENDSITDKVDEDDEKPSDANSEDKASHEKSTYGLFSRLKLPTSLFGTKENAKSDYEENEQMGLASQSDDDNSQIHETEKDESGTKASAVLLGWRKVASGFFGISSTTSAKSEGDEVTKQPAEVLASQDEPTDDENDSGSDDNEIKDKAVETKAMEADANPESVRDLTDDESDNGSEDNEIIVNAVETKAADVEANPENAEGGGNVEIEIEGAEIEVNQEFVKDAENGGHVNTLDLLENQEIVDSPVTEAKSPNSFFSGLARKFNMKKTKKDAMETPTDEANEADSLPPSPLYIETSPDTIVDANTNSEDVGAQMEEDKDDAVGAKSRRKALVAFGSAGVVKVATMASRFNPLNLRSKKRVNSENENEITEEKEEDILKDIENTELVEEKETIGEAESIGEAVSLNQETNDVARSNETGNIISDLKEIDDEAESNQETAKSKKFTLRALQVGAFAGIAAASSKASSAASRTFLRRSKQAEDTATTEQAETDSSSPTDGEKNLANVATAPADTELDEGGGSNSSTRRRFFPVNASALLYGMKSKFSTKSKDDQKEESVTDDHTNGIEPLISDDLKQDEIEKNESKFNPEVQEQLSSYSFQEATTTSETDSLDSHTEENDATTTDDANEDAESVEDERFADLDAIPMNEEGVVSSGDTDSPIAPGIAEKKAETGNEMELEDQYSQVNEDSEIVEKVIEDAVSESVTKIENLESGDAVTSTENSKEADTEMDAESDNIEDEVGEHDEILQKLHDGLQTDLETSMVLADGLEKDLGFKDSKEDSKPESIENSRELQDESSGGSVVSSAEDDQAGSEFVPSKDFESAKTLTSDLDEDSDAKEEDTKSESIENSKELQDESSGGSVVSSAEDDPLGSEFVPSKDFESAKTLTSDLDEEDEDSDVPEDLYAQEDEEKFPVKDVLVDEAAAMAVANVIPVPDNSKSIGQSDAVESVTKGDTMPAMPDGDRIQETITGSPSVEQERDSAPGDSMPSGIEKDHGLIPGRGLETLESTFIGISLPLSTDSSFINVGKKAEISLWRLISIDEDEYDSDDEFENGYHVCELQEEEYGNFYENESYLVLNTYARSGRGKKKGGKLRHDIHCWLGKNVDEDKARSCVGKALELDVALDGNSVIHCEMQGFESTLFQTYFNTKGIRYLEGGIESGFLACKTDEYKPVLYAIRNQKAAVKAFPLPFKFESLNHSSSYVLDAGKDVAVWHGDEANPFEKYSAATMCQNLITSRLGKAKKASEDLIFEHLPRFNSSETSSDDVEALPEDSDRDCILNGVSLKDPKLKRKNVQLFRVDQSGNGEVRFELIPRGKGSLSFSKIEKEKSNQDLFLFASSIGVFVWVSNEAVDAAKANALLVGMEFQKLNSDYMHLPVTRVTETMTDQSNAFRMLFKDLPTV